MPAGAQQRSLVVVALQARPCWPQRTGWVGLWEELLWRCVVPTSQAKQRLNHRLTLDQGRAEFTATPIASEDDVFERNGLARQFGVDGATHELVVEVDPQFGHIARVVANGHVLSDIRGQGRVEIAKALEMNAILVDTPRLGHRQEQ